MNRTVILPALLGSHPLGALASFGLLRLAASIDASARLAFVMEDDFIAKLSSNTLSEKALIEGLIAWSASDAPARPLGWAEDVRVPPAEFKRVLHQALSEEDAILASFLPALAAEGAVDRQKGRIKPTAFYMASGQQSFISGMREILQHARKAPEAVFKEALFGPWKYTTRSHSLGWDPNTERLHAYRHRAPTSEKPSCVPGAVLLAFWALPIMPTLSSEQRAQTTCFLRVERRQSFCWPVFTSGVSVDELASLLQVGPRSWFRTSNEHRSGIAGIFESERAEFGQGYAVLRPAQALRTFDRVASL